MGGVFPNESSIPRQREVRIRKKRGRGKGKASAPAEESLQTPEAPANIPPPTSTHLDIRQFQKCNFHFRKSTPDQNVGCSNANCPFSHDLSCRFDKILDHINHTANATSTLL